MSVSNSTASLSTRTVLNNEQEKSNSEQAGSETNNNIQPVQARDQQSSYDQMRQNPTELDELMNRPTELDEFMNRPTELESLQSTSDAGDQQAANDKNAGVSDYMGVVFTGVEVFTNTFAELGMNMAKLDVISEIRRLPDSDIAQNLDAIVIKLTDFKTNLADTRSFLGEVRPEIDRILVEAEEVAKNLKLVGQAIGTASKLQETIQLVSSALDAWDESVNASSSGERIANVIGGVIKEIDDIALPAGAGFVAGVVTSYVGAVPAAPLAAASVSTAAGKAYDNSVFDNFIDNAIDGVLEPAIAFSIDEVLEPAVFDFAENIFKLGSFIEKALPEHWR